MKKFYLIIINMLALASITCFNISCTNMLSLAQESQMGIRQFQEYKKTNKISNNSSYNARVRRVGNRIKNVINSPNVANVNWEFVVFENSKPNAFALPGGKVGVHTGMFKIARNDAQLAAVLAHEIAHVTERHGGQTMTRQMGVGLGAAVLDSVLQSKGVGTGIRSAAQMGADVGLVKPFSRSKEYEADKIGAFYMARAGYDPRDSITLWQRFAEYKRQQGGSTPEFLSTHPIDSNRIAQLRSIMPQALAIYQGKSTYSSPSSLSSQFTPSSNSSNRVYRARRF